MAVSSRKVKNKRDSGGKLTGRPGTVYDVNIKYKTASGVKTYSKKGFVTKKAAVIHEGEMKSRLQNPGQTMTVTKQSRQNVCKYLYDWVENYAKHNSRPATYVNYKNTIKAYIIPHIGGTALNELTPAMIDNMLRSLMNNGLSDSTAASAKRVLSAALEHARKYGYIPNNAARDTLTKFKNAERKYSPYTLEQVSELFKKSADTEWEMPIMLGALYGMRRSEILGLRWENVDLKSKTFEVSEQLPFEISKKANIIEQMAPPKSKSRILPITDFACSYFEKQLAVKQENKQRAETAGSPYYENRLVVCKPNGTFIPPHWISGSFCKKLNEWALPHIRFHDLRRTAATNMHQLTGDFYTVGEILGHTLAGIGSSLGLPVNFEAVTARYVDVRLERKREVLDTYHNAINEI